MTGPLEALKAEFARNGTPNEDVAGSGPCGWEPADLGAALNGSGPPPPDLWPRADGVHLLYRGRVHAFVGEPESMKSWGWQCATISVLAAGGRVLALDFENDVNSVVDRLRQLGAPADQLLGGLVYIAPTEPWGPAASTLIRELIERERFDLAVIDGVTDGMGALGFDINSNTDAAKFDRLLVKPLARTGAAVVLADHVVKDRDGRGRYAIGAQHKLAAITGASFLFEVLQPFGREQEGLARLTVTKDKPGYLRQHAAGRKVAATLRLKSWPDGGITSALEPPQAAGGSTGFVPTVIMERVSRYVETHPGLSLRAVIEGVSGKRDVVILAVELLVSEGFLIVQPGPNRAQLHRSARPYREGFGGQDGEDDDPAF